MIEEFVDNALMASKDHIIGLIDKGLWVGALNTLRKAVPLYCEENYAYKGEELCNRLISAWEREKDAIMPSSLHNDICMVRDRFFISRMNSGW